MLAQGSQTNAKEDTRILLLAGDLDADLSQYGTNLTAASAGGYEVSSARTAITGAREVYVRCTLAAEVSRTLINHGNHGNTDRTFAIRIDAAGLLTLRQNAATLWTSPATAPIADVSIAWSTRANPDTTGAANAMISEIIVYNHDAGEWVYLEQFAHAAATTNTSWTFSVNGYWDSAAMLEQPTNDPTEARVSCTFHPNVEFAEDWVAARTTYTAGSLDDEIAEPVGPIPVSSAIGDSPQLVGRAQVGYSGARSNATQRRGWSPLVNDVFVDVDTMTSTPGPTNWATLAPGSTLYTLMIPWLRWIPVPTGATHAWVRIHVKTWVTSGAAVPIGFRVYALNRTPAKVKIGQIPAPALEYAYKGAVLTVDHTSTGLGEWIEIGLVRLPVFAAAIDGWQDTVHLCLAYDVDPAAASANDANARVQINAWHARPVTLWTPGGLAGE